MTGIDTDQRGQGLLRVVVWFVSSLFLFYLFTLLYGKIIEPILAVVQSFSSVSNAGYMDTVDLTVKSVSLAGMFLGVSIVLLFLVYAVWRENFLGPGGRR